MGDLLENIIQTIGKDKKNYILIVIFILVFIGIIVYIWIPKPKDYLTYGNVNIEEKQESLASMYINEISLLFRTSDTDAVSELISSEYLDYTGKSRNEVVNELQNAGFFALHSKLKGMDVYTDDTTYIYSTTIYSPTNNERRINIVETYPYEYNIVFDDFYDYSTETKSTTNEGIKFTLDSTYRNLKYIKFNMRIENQNNSYARFDFNSSTGVQAVLSDGTRYPMANMISTSERTNIETNETVNKEFVFEIPAQLQEGIEYIVFNGVTMEFSSMNIKFGI